MSFRRPVAPSVEPATLEARWKEFGCSEATWESLRTSWQDKKVWFFAKGPSFNKKFPFNQLRKDEDFVIALNQTIEYLPYAHILTTQDFHIRLHLFQRGYGPNMISAYKGDWPAPKGSTDLAFIIMGELGIKDITSVGMDWGGNNGFPYRTEYPGMPKHVGGIPVKRGNILEKLKNVNNSRVKSYGMTLTKYVPWPH